MQANHCCLLALIPKCSWSCKESGGARRSLIAQGAEQQVTQACEPEVFEVASAPVLAAHTMQCSLQVPAVWSCFGISQRKQSHASCLIPVWHRLKQGMQCARECSPKCCFLQCNLRSEVGFLQAAGSDEQIGYLNITCTKTLGNMTGHQAAHAKSKGAAGGC